MEKPSLNSFAAGFSEKFERTVMGEAAQWEQNIAPLSQHSFLSIFLDRSCRVGVCASAGHTNSLLLRAAMDRDEPAQSLLTALDSSQAVQHALRNISAINGVIRSMGERIVSVGWERYRTYLQIFGADLWGNLHTSPFVCAGLAQWGYTKRYPRVTGVIARELEVTFNYQQFHAESRSNPAAFGLAVTRQFGEDLRALRVFVRETVGVKRRLGVGLKTQGRSLIPPTRRGAINLIFAPALEQKKVSINVPLLPKKPRRRL